jgi:uncharacterized RmlC-like cupin family protein
MGCVTVPFVVHPDEAVPGPSTPAMLRRQLHSDGDRWVGWIQTDAGLAGGWHHHAANDSYVYVLRGTLTIDFGPGGRESVVGRAGDFLCIPARTVHRETTAPDEPVEAFLVRIGGEPQVVNLEGPDPG